MYSKIKLEKLINHEQSARLLGSIAEADAFAAKVERLMLEQGRDLSQASVVQIGQVDSALHAVGFVQTGAGQSSRRKEWSERLAYACAAAFNCELLLKAGSSALFFRGNKSGRSSAAQLYSELAKQATKVCAREFLNWKQRRGEAGPAAVRSLQSRRWKRSFLLGFSLAACEHFICSQQCRRDCVHVAKLVHIGQVPYCSAEAAPSRAIGGFNLHYDALYRGGAKARLVLADMTRPFAA